MLPKQRTTAKSQFNKKFLPFIVIADKLIICRARPKCSVNIGRDLTFSCFISFINLTVCRTQTPPHLSYPIPSSNYYSSDSQGKYLPLCLNSSLLIFLVRRMDCRRSIEDQINSSESSRVRFSSDMWADHHSCPLKLVKRNDCFKHRMPHIFFFRWIIFQITCFIPMDNTEKLGWIAQMQMSKIWRNLFPINRPNIFNKQKIFISECSYTHNPHL